jgi:RNA polymerase sigma-70 factor, ECF subfamily
MVFASSDARGKKMNTVDVTYLYKKYSSMVENVSFRGTHSREAAEDVRQQVFMNIFKSVDGFRNECQLKTWIYQITLNECYHYRLRNWRETRKVTAFVENVCEATDEVGHWDDKMLVQRLLDLADSETQKAMVMMYTKEMTQEQIAKALGVSRVTVINRLDKFRAVAVAAMGVGR